MGFSIWQLLILLAIIVLLFGTKRLRGMGSDIGSAVKGFKKSVADDDDKPADKSADSSDKLDDKSERDDKQDR